MSAFFSSSIIISGKKISCDGPAYIIAEAGVAHFGNTEKAFRLVDLASATGADAVKFQMFDVDALIAEKNTEWKERLGSRQLSEGSFLDLKAYCAEKGITFLCTAHDAKSLLFVHDQLEVPAFKVGSGEVRNTPFIASIAGLGKPVILSTGMHSLDDISNVVDIFKKHNNPNLILLHCVTSYPVPYAQVNLRFMGTIQREFGVITGYSDHTKGYHVPLAAIALGARVVEKHITLDYNVPNAQDWKVSCGPSNLARFIRQAREIEKAQGDPAKNNLECEKDAIIWARKSLVAAFTIPPGTVITEKMLAYKRPGDGIPPDEAYTVIGKLAAVCIKQDSQILHEYLNE
jgi:N-acetylneuraminate synthase/N,N'-diacetyllegionaminate synthase